MNVAILGAGLSGISLAYFLQNKEAINSIEIIEKEHECGGLCRSFKFHNIHYDIGPHIIFSKNKEILNLMKEVLGDNLNQYRRSNRIYYKGILVKYPFENQLSALPKEERKFCLDTFLSNPYETYNPQNMLQFFLATFGEGITNKYLRPYNEKIWKYDPAFINTKMVDRIPKPPKEDIIKSAKGISTEGYLHQLYFYYPKKYGIEFLIKAFQQKLSNKVKISLPVVAKELKKIGNSWQIKGSNGFKKKFDAVISTIPVPELNNLLGNLVPQNIRESVSCLKYNSIVICVLKVKTDMLKGNFAVMIPDKNIVFHRISRLNFLYKDIADDTKSVYLMAEITYRKNDIIDQSSDKKLAKMVVDDLIRLRFIDTVKDCTDFDIKRFKYAYVIYDLDYERNIGIIKKYYEKKLNIKLNGRFGEFEYLNMDAVISHSFKLGQTFEKTFNLTKGRI